MSARSWWHWRRAHVYGVEPELTLRENAVVLEPLLVMDNMLGRPAVGRFACGDKEFVACVFRDLQPYFDHIVLMTWLAFRKKRPLFLTVLNIHKPDEEVIYACSPRPPETEPDHSPTMSKLFIGVPVDVPEMAYAHAGISATNEDRQQHPHLTFMFCGSEMTAADVDKMLPAWEDVLDKVADENHRRIVLTTEYALFGKENDVLVLKCRVSPELEDAIGFARAKSAELVPHMPPSDFPFSAHVTLGKASALPPAVKDLDDFGSQVFHQIVFWGDEYRARRVLGDDPDMPPLSKA